MATHAPSQSRRKHGSLAEQAYVHIRERILTGDLAIGAELSRRKLAVEYGMSFVPVMEALQRLENEGLVESRPRVGTRVRVPTPCDIREQYILREALECQSAWLFSEKASADERRELAIIAGQLDELDDNKSLGQQNSRALFLAGHRLHMHLHMRLAECTGCSALVRAIQLNQTLVFKWLFDTVYQRPPKPQGWHRTLIEAVSGTNPEAAAAAMRIHTRHGLNAVLEALTPLSGLEALNENRFSGSTWRSR
jgi:DNA-binding GntR family transcriptional regulator